MNLGELGKVNPATGKTEELTAADHIDKAIEVQERHISALKLQKENIDMELKDSIRKLGRLKKLKGQV